MRKLYRYQLVRKDGLEAGHLYDNLGAAERASLGTHAVRELVFFHQESEWAWIPGSAAKWPPPAPHEVRDHDDAILEAVEKRLTPDSWIRESSAEDENGKLVHAQHPHAVCWCLDGAVDLESYLSDRKDGWGCKRDGYTRTYHRIMDRLDEQVFSDYRAGIITHVVPVPDSENRPCHIFNDHPETTLEHVHALIDRTLAAE